MPVAGFDIDRLDTEIRLTVFAGGETFHGLGRDVPENVSTGEIGYQSGGEPLSRHFMWRQSRNAALNNQTSNLLLITEAVQGVSQDAMNAMTDTLSEGLTRWFGTSAQVVQLDALHPQASV